MIKSKEQAGLFSSIATFVFLVLIGLKCQVYGLVSRELLLLLTGNVRDIAASTASFLMMFPVILATVTLELPFAILGGWIQGVILGDSGKHAVKSMVDSMAEGHHFYDFFVTVLLEELFARALFLGVLAKLPLLNGVPGFYILFFLGNALWALIHLSNFQKEDQKCLRVLPQFIAGIFFTYIYMKYGLLAVVLTHFASNAVIFANFRKQNIDVVDFYITNYCIFTMAVSYFFMEKPMSDAVLWFNDNPTYVLPGWGVMDYLKFSVFVTSTLMSLFGLMMYDRGEAGKKEPSIFERVLGLPLTILIVYMIFSFMGLFITSLTYRVLWISIILTFAHKGESMSAMTRTFWVFLPDTYTTLCIIQALGFLPCLLWLTLETIVHAPRLYLTRFDD